MQIPRSRLGRHGRAGRLRKLRSRPVQIHGPEAHEEEGDRLERDLHMEGDEEPGRQALPRGWTPGREVPVHGGRKTRGCLELLQGPERGDGSPEQRELRAASGTLPEVILDHPARPRFELILEICR